jgi:predicted DsbA family dithiol-disulfide isomerase
MSMNKIRIDIWSDIACPWCWVGKRHLEQAIEKFPHKDNAEIDVHWHAFELDPSAKTPAQRNGNEIAYAERLAKKYGMSVKHAEDRIRQMTETAKKDGLDFRFDRVKPTNTFDAHRVVHLGGTKSTRLQDTVKERLLKAYMNEGELVSDHETLVRVAGEAGLDTEEVRAMLASDQFTNEVRGEEQEARELGIHGVPFFVVAEKYAIEGAQPAEILLRALTLSWDALPKKEKLVSLEAGEGAVVCGPEGCEVPNTAPRK